MFFLADTTKKVDNSPLQYVLLIPLFFCSVLLRNSSICLRIAMKAIFFFGSFVATPDEYTLYHT